jgi:hypothetical protein
VRVGSHPKDVGLDADSVLKVLVQCWVGDGKCCRDVGSVSRDVDSGVGWFLENILSQHPFGCPERYLI